MARGLKRNNKGSTLVMVLVAVSFVAIIGIMALAFAAVNVEMKNIDRKSKANFYYTEKAVDEIYAGIGMNSMDALREAYLYMSKNLVEYDAVSMTYSAVSDEDAVSMLNTHFFDALCDYYGSTSDEVVEKFNEYITVDNGQRAQVKSIGDITYEDDKLTYEEVYISYTNDLGYYTNISVDIVIDAPINDLELSGDENSAEEEYKTYAVIAADKVDINASTNLMSNMYAGDGGINLTSDIRFNAVNDYIVTRGNFDIRSGTSVRIGNMSYGNASIWARNIITSGSTNNYTTLNINGNCFLADDMEFNCNNTIASVAGSIYGYGNGLTVDSSSSININGKNTTVDFTRLNNMIVAGTAYIDFASEEVGTYITGNSIGIRAAQDIYMVPSEYISTGINPNYSKNEVTVQIPEDFFGYRYLDNTPYVVKKVGELSYYYLNFKDITSATAYYEEYLINNADSLNTIFTKMQVGDIKIFNSSNENSINVYSLGSLVEVSKNGNSFDINVTNTDNNTINIDELTSNLSNRYLYMCNQLKDFGDITDIVDTVPTLKTSPIYNYVNMDLIREELAEGQIIEGTEYAGTNTAAIIINNENGEPYVLDSSYESGIVVATGDIIVRTSKFRGTIISDGNISIEMGTTLQSNAAVITDILNNCSQIIRYFYMEDELDEAIIDNSFIQHINYTDYISTENWMRTGNVNSEEEESSE